MKNLRLRHSDAETPETWAEGYNMLCAMMDAYYNKRGANIARLSVAARVAYGLFGKQLMAADPTIALIYLLQRICEREGAGLDS